jgi:hypothetical protein
MSNGESDGATICGVTDPGALIATVSSIASHAAAESGACATMES